MITLTIMMILFLGIPFGMVLYIAFIEFRHSIYSKKRGWRPCNTCANFIKAKEYTPFSAPAFRYARCKAYIDEDDGVYNYLSHYVQRDSEYRYASIMRNSSLRCGSYGKKYIPIEVVK